MPILPSPSTTGQYRQQDPTPEPSHPRQPTYLSTSTLHIRRLSHSRCQHTTAAQALKHLNRAVNVHPTQLHARPCLVKMSYPPILLLPQPASSTISIVKAPSSSAQVTTPSQALTLRPEPDPCTFAMPSHATVKHQMSSQCTWLLTLLFSNMSPTAVQLQCRSDALPDDICGDGSWAL
ncbi:hypothetical protein C8F01DRAFT_1374994 [Mycena amicta]|nr:hypothetical protein C8F01DRAFT_1374994 [Mycena amicta]